MRCRVDYSIYSILSGRLVVCVTFVADFEDISVTYFEYVFSRCQIGLQLHKPCHPVYVPSFRNEMISCFTEITNMAWRGVVILRGNKLTCQGVV